jgi:hypothetical protein
VSRRPTGQPDSAGVPWSGRTLAAQPFAGDSGEPDPRLQAALAAHAAGSAETSDVVVALAAARVMVAVVAIEHESAFDPGTGRAADSRAEMALVTLTGPDGRRALPVFSGTASLAGWDPRARPVPVESARAAQASVAEGCDLIVLDPGGPICFQVCRPAVWALGQGRRWLPSPTDPDVLAAVRLAALAGGQVRSVTCRPGRAAELRVLLGLPEGLDAEGLEAVLAGVRDRLAADRLLAERVDSVELAPVRHAAGSAP